MSVLINLRYIRANVRYIDFIGLTINSYLLNCEIFSYWIVFYIRLTYLQRHIFFGWCLFNGCYLLYVQFYFRVCYNRKVLCCWFLLLCFLLCFNVRQFEILRIIQIEDKHFNIEICNVVSIVWILVISTTLYVMVERIGFWWESNPSSHKKSETPCQITYGSIPQIPLCSDSTKLNIKEFQSRRLVRTRPKTLCHKRVLIYDV